jgi:glycosyltransferase involved in cell wall biosynthesis
MRRFVVITPVLNGRRFVEQTLASIDAQTYDNWVHYVVDGGSTDGTLEILRESSAAQARRHVIEGPDHGLYDGLFKGFDQAKRDGSSPDDICFWINADDLVMPWAFMTVARAFDDSGAEWITGLPSIWDENGRLTLVHPVAWYPRGLIRRGWFHARALTPIQQESTFFTRRLLDRVSPEAISVIRATRLAGDFILWRRFAETARLQVIPTAISGFRLHGSNASVAQQEVYLAEVKKSGAPMIPGVLGKPLRLVFYVIALFANWLNARRHEREATRARLPIR